MALGNLHTGEHLRLRGAHDPQTATALYDPPPLAPWLPHNRPSAPLSSSHEPSRLPPTARLQRQLVHLRCGTFQHAFIAATQLRLPLVSLSS